MSFLFGVWGGILIALVAVVVAVSVDTWREKRRDARFRAELDAIPYADGDGDITTAASLLSADLTSNVTSMTRQHR